jgi:His-Xaa-Ser system radical SAM maturase HxsB
MGSITNNYKLLPFRFHRANGRVLLVNDVGEYISLNDATFTKFIDHTIDTKSNDFMSLKSSFMAYESNLDSIIELLATKYRSRKQFLFDFTSLHIIVLTERCNQKCTYCHASSIDDNATGKHDMNSTTAKKCVDAIFSSPSHNIKIEFQGGEPFLNFEVLKEIVEYSEEVNSALNKNLEFVICSNLIALDANKLDYLKTKNIPISTSLDGPKDIHDTCRILRNGRGSYDIFSRNLRWASDELGINNISALMTVTPYNINRLNDVIYEYIQQGFGSIFLRMMNPFGYARDNKVHLQYSVDDFLESYKAALDYIIKLNLEGRYFPENYTTLLLRRILTPFSTGFVDLQSPAGAGISCAVYYVNGDVYVSDEARMLAKSSGDKYFCLGNVHSATWKEMFCGDLLKRIVSESCIESLPGCAWCVYQPYCGGDPVRNYALQGNMVSSKAENYFCEKHKGLFNILFDYILEDNDDIQDVFWSWITGKNLEASRIR